jgi:hypothetical protein
MEVGPTGAQFMEGKQDVLREAVDEGRKVGFPIIAYCQRKRIGRARIGIVRQSQANYSTSPFKAE